MKKTAFDTLTDAIGCVRDRRTTAKEQGDGDMETHLNEVVERLQELRRQAAPPQQEAVSLMSDALRAAAERLQFLEPGDTMIGLSEQVRMLARAYLAAHPPDDDTPIDEAWVRTIKGEIIRDDPDEADIGPVLVIMLGATENGEPVRIIWGFGFGSELCCNIGIGPAFVRRHTRGDVRRLCAALGVPLNESEAGR